MQHPIEEGRPIPARAAPRRSRTAYPLSLMEIGQSFFVSVDVERIAGETEESYQERRQRAARARATTVSSAISARRRAIMDGRRFTSRKIDDGAEFGIRVWRIEDGEANPPVRLRKQRAKAAE